MTTAAGPQSLSDCHTCFISGNTTLAGAATGLGRISRVVTVGVLATATGPATLTLAAASSVGVVSRMAALCAGATGRKAIPPASTTPMVRAKTLTEAPRPLICDVRVALRPVRDESGCVPDTYHPAMSPTTLVRGRLRDHPLWSRALAAPEMTGRLIQPVIVSARVEDRERVPDAPFLERLSIT